jgi:hypothetical protein
VADPRAALEAAWRGDFAPAARLRPALGKTAVARAWGLALDGAAWHAGAGGGLPSAADVERFAAEDRAAALPASLACVHAAHASLLAFDRGGLEAWVAHLARVAPASDDPEPAAWLEALAGFADLWADRASEAVQRARAAAALAARAKLAPVVVEAAALAALAALATGARDEAIASARRASRMARTEALPWPEYLANVALARIRRHSGKPHMAIHILRALRKVVPDPWHAWVAWEVCVAAGPAESGALAGSVPAVQALGVMLEAARRGDRRAFADASRGCRAAVAAIFPLAAELDALVAALDPAVDPAGAPATLRGWLTGADADIPAGLQGLASPGGGEEGGAGPTAFVVARPDGAARRILGLGAALAGASVDPTHRPGRSEAAISALALAGDAGLTRADLFAGVYGFPYVPIRHQGVLDVLLHRVRGEIAPRARIDKRGDRLVFLAPEGFVVADPRCAGPEDDQLLRVLATRGGGTAKGAAEALGIPLRTAQAALQALVQEGVCIAERRGRLVEYRVEDTTFSEPTQR